MGIKGTVEKGDWLDTDGSFIAKCVKVEEKEAKFGPVVHFIFEILNDPEQEGKQVTGMFSKKVTPDNKTAKILNALDPEFEFEIDMEFDFEDFVGKVCRVLVAESEGERTFYNVVKARALKPKETEELQAIEKKAKKEAMAKFKGEKKEEEPVEKKSESKSKPSKADDDEIDF